MSFGGGAVLVGVADASIRCVVMELGRSVVNPSGFVVQVGGSAVRIGGVLVGYVGALGRQMRIVLADGLPAKQLGTALAQLLGPSLDPVLGFVGHEFESTGCNPSGVLESAFPSAIPASRVGGPLGRADGAHQAGYRHPQV